MRLLLVRKYGASSEKYAKRPAKTTTSTAVPESAGTARRRGSAAAEPRRRRTPAPTLRRLAAGELRIVLRDRGAVAELALDVERLRNLLALDRADDVLDRDLSVAL